jgi:hypothetical protein
MNAAQFRAMQSAAESESELARVQAVARDLADALDTWQWADEGHCPACGHRSGGHRPGCSIAAALKRYRSESDA